MDRRNRGHRRPSRASRAARAGVVAALIAGGGAAIAATSLGLHFARRVLTPARRPEAGVEVLAVDAGGSSGLPTVRLRGPDAALQGRYSFIFDGGAHHARLGPAVSGPSAAGAGSDVPGGGVVRTIVGEDRGRLRAGARGRVTGWWFTDPNELGLEVDSVEIPVEGGLAPAWQIGPAPGSAVVGRWAVHVHGRGALPEEVLRGVAPVARAGTTSLVIAYRNDPGAPRGQHGRYGLGLAEQRDVDAAIAWARERGAERVTLVGWSMGGTASLLAATRGPHRGRIDGIVLDSPAVDWPGVLRHQALLAGAPKWVGALGSLALRLGVVRGAVPGERGTDVSSLTPEAFAARLHVPVLIHASPDDSYVPWEGALRLARLRPALVTLRAARGEHVKLWNVDPEGWERATEAFVRELRDPSRNSEAAH